MSAELELFESRLERDFRAFHALNPHVYQELVSLARTAKHHGRRRYGIGALFEIMRWNWMIQTVDEKFKLNNNHRAYYARLIMQREPDLAGFFETREDRDATEC